MEVLILNEEDMEPNTLIVPIIKISWLKRVRGFSWCVWVAFPLWNCEDLKDMISEVSKLQVIKTIGIMLNFDNVNIN